MAPKNMLELLETQLKDCWIKGTHISDSGLTVSIERLRGEVIHFFQTDSDLARKCLEMEGEGKPICDCLVFYALKENHSNCEVICFLELKGGDFDHAVDQVIHTYKRVHALSKREIQSAQLQYIVSSASIIIHGRSPRISEQHKARLRQNFKHRTHIKHVDKKKYTKLGDFLRGLYQECAS